MDRLYKLIEYNGGEAKFRIPADWIEDQEDDGAGVYYADDDESGTLRIGVMTFRHEPPIDHQTVVEMTHERGAEPGYRAEVLESGNCMLFHAEEGEEDGERILLFVWEIVRFQDPDIMRVAVFTYTILADQRYEKRFQEEVEMLNAQLSRTEFGPPSEGYAA